MRGSSPLDHCSLLSQMWRAQEIDFTRAPKGCMCLKRVIIKITSSSIMVLPLRLGPSHQCEGIFAPGNCGGWLRLVPRATRGWGVCSAGWLNLLSGRWAAQGPFFPLEAFSDACPIQPPSTVGAGTDSAAQVLVSKGLCCIDHSPSPLTGPLQLQRRYAELEEEMLGEEEVGIREEERGLTHVYIIYQDLTVI